MINIKVGRMSLFDKLNSIENWKYYKQICIKNYKEAISRPNDFIKEYFDCGSKTDFILDSIYENNKIRAKHVVNTYFLGVYLINEIEWLKPKLGFLAKEENWLWAWFLCSLYHDAYIQETEEDKDEECNDYCENICYDYCKYTEKFLYSQKTLEKYYDKNKSVKTSYNNKIHYDHGIVAASKLYKNYLSLLNEHITNAIYTINDFFGDNRIITDSGLIITYKSFIAICKIAKIIACHNIFVCNNKDDSEKYKSSGLSHLIIGNPKFHKMPHKNIFYNDEYNKLYYLLALVDSLEPTKRGVEINDIDIVIKNANNIKLNLLNSNTNGYIGNIKRITEWLRGIEVSEDGTSLFISNK